MFRIRQTLHGALAPALSVAAYFPLLAGAPPPAATSGMAATASPTAAAAATHGIDLSAIDRSVAPGDDFFHYANGAWLKRTEIPPDRSDIGVPGSLIDLSQKRIAGL